MPTWPLQSQCDSFYGNPRGTNGQENPVWKLQNIVNIVPPFRMLYGGAPVRSVRIHRKCADDLRMILAEIWERCGHDQTKADACGITDYGGSYEFRLMRGRSSLSMHSYGCAIDFDVDRNGHHAAKHFFQPGDVVVSTFEAHGWVWGGRWAGTSVDAMHFQAARVG
ncbi:M15 family metallopeptidase [uncultured Alsobacter sp.]|uniref:M15 family metallopeptidase n=1 Tax=uncultured Alsobacter sp. TaxID=1748258 RepID=UPI0025D1D6EE|nr:M15 family metallopeptidase [uncultured Alsobacter sp.]